MSLPQVVVTDVQVRGHTIYTCDDCGAQGRGDTAALHYAYMPEENKLGRDVTPSHMPVGWGAYGRLSYKCPRCAK